MSDRQTILGLALGLSVLACSAARAEWHDIIGSEKGALVVVDGKVRLAKSGHPGPFEGWDLGPPGGKQTIQVRSDDRWSGWYLAFDAGGKNPKVTLARNKPGLGTVWQLTRVKGRGYTLQATSGKYKGWYLDAGKAHTVKGKDGKKYTDYEAVLEKDPKKPLKFSIYEVAP
jgi:hypothetical protein